MNLSSTANAPNSGSVMINFDTFFPRLILASVTRSPLTRRATFLAASIIQVTYCFAFPYQVMISRRALSTRKVSVDPVFLLTKFRGCSVVRIMRPAIYARVSTKDQSCEMQMRDLRAYCAARGFTITREYIDIAQSGAKDSRPQLNELMADARKRKFDSILVWRFDRFANSTKHLLLALEEFRSLGVQFISYQENIDTSSPLGQALFTIVSAVAQLERDLIRERVGAGIRHAQACGKQLGRPRRIVSQDEVRRLRSDGASLRQIAEKLGIGYGSVRLLLIDPSATPANGRTD